MVISIENIAQYVKVCTLKLLIWLPSLPTNNDTGVFDVANVAVWVPKIYSVLNSVKPASGFIY